MNRRGFLSSIAGAVAAVATGLGLKSAPKPEFTHFVDLGCINGDTGEFIPNPCVHQYLNIGTSVDPNWEEYKAHASRIVAQNLGMPASLLEQGGYNFSSAKADHEAFYRHIKRYAEIRGLTFKE